jgi:hypothetical protein
MTIASPDDPTSVTVITETFGYPQQMVEAIRGQLEARRTHPAIVAAVATRARAIESD